MAGSDLDNGEQLSSCEISDMALNAIGRLLAYVAEIMFPVPLWVYGRFAAISIFSGGNAGNADQLTSEQANDPLLKWIVLQQNSVRLIASPPAAWAAP